MRRFLILVLLLPAACRTERPVPAEAERPVKVIVAADASVVDRDFPGLATPDDAVNLAFKVAGQVLDVPVSRGDSVGKGQLLAELDPRDFQLRVDAERSVYDQSSARLARMKRLLAHEAISVQDYEAAQTQYAQARSAYENAKDVLKDTKLRAPYTGVVEAAYVDNYERVNAGQTILRLVKPLTDVVSFTLPESGLPLLGQPATRFKVRFDNFRGAVFGAVLKDYARTSSDASGFPVSLRVENPDPKRYPISPGMSCTISLQSTDPTAGAVWLPLTAVYAPASGGTYVWIVGPDDRVALRPVRLGEPGGRDRIVVDSGVEPGERVVTAGVYRLREGQRVRILN